MIAGPPAVTDALVTADRNVIVSAPPLSLSDTGTFLEPVLTLIPEASALAFRAKRRPRGSRIVTAFSAGANVPAVIENVSFGRPLPRPRSLRALPNCGAPGTTTAHVNEVEPVLPNASVARTVTVVVCRVAGVPEMTPVVALRLSPAGRPVAL